MRRVASLTGKIRGIGRPISWALILAAPLAALSQPALAQTKVIVGFTQFNEVAPVMIAKEEEFFAKHGLDVTIQLIPLNSLMPAALGTSAYFPKLLVNLKCAMSPADVSSLEADLAVQLIRPNSPELKVVRLGFLHTIPFAAQSYINTCGVPAALEELKRHRFVLHVAEQTQARTLFGQYAPDLPWIGTVALETNVASAHLWAVAKGAGIGWLPTYTHFIGGRIVPIEAGPRFVFEIWLTYHPDVARIARVRRVIDWVRDSFDAQKFPWFGEQFVHPYDLPKAYRGEPLINMFEGFVHANSGIDQVFGGSNRSVLP